MHVSNEISGDSYHPLLYLVFSSVLNVILDLVLVAGFHMGVSGAAIATVFLQGVSACCCLILFFTSVFTSYGGHYARLW